MSKRALKKRRAELEALLVDRYEALGEVVLGMHAHGEWDDQTLARGAAEVREVITELDTLDLEQESSSPPQAVAPAVDDTGSLEQARTDVGEPESRADHLLAETAEHQIDEEEMEEESVSPQDDAPADAGEEEEQTETETAKSLSETRPETGDADRGGTREDSSTPGPDTQAEPVGAGGDTGGPRSDPDEAKADRPEEPQEPKKAAAPVADTPEPAARPLTEPGDQGTELESVTARIDETERQAKVASEAARAALQADSKTELSAITRAIQGEQASLDRALEVAAKRIHDAEREAENARARLARELASNREAAASWVRNQAEEIEADAALAQEMASGAYEDEAGGLGGDAGEARLQAMESEITSLRANLEAEKASKAEALAKAEVRVREIEAAAREAERKVDEARKWAPEEARLEERRAQEAELREAAVLWLRGQVAAMREQGKTGDSSTDGPSEGGPD